MPDKLVDKPVSQLLEAFASSAPTPGGGSASALAGAVGASLLMMVASLPKTRHGSDEDRAALSDAKAALSPAARELADLVDRDADAYDVVVAAYRLPKSSDAEKAARRQAIQRGMRGAIDTPLAMLRAIHTAARSAVAVARHGNTSAASDVIVAAALLDAAASGAYANVTINLGGLEDAEQESGLGREARTLREAVGAEAATARAACAAD
ncbi:MAG TPA: cyclodeaminase/cyclohydrolase family protein [Vicinamibacterales bacterium]|jgi:formiminotetrahydrofolate cyclodeaminase|nr:cyclodeaminase/cyclohydrolase family protein [Vicinamibacterales bacterium]